MFIHTENDTRSDKRIKLTIYNTNHTQNTQILFQKYNCSNIFEQLETNRNISNKKTFFFYYISKFHNSYFVCFIDFVYFVSFGGGTFGVILLGGGAFTIPLGYMLVTTLRRATRQALRVVLKLRTLELACALQCVRRRWGPPVIKNMRQLFRKSPKRNRKN